jgi:hypothetical protein
MNARLIKTSFHTDGKVEALSKDAKWLFMYVLTCPYIGLTGAFQLSDKRLCYETSITQKELAIAKDELHGTIEFVKGWVIVRNSGKHNSYSNSPLTQKGYDKEFELLPEFVKDVLKGLDTPLKDPSKVINTHININNNINKIEEGGAGETEPDPQKLQKERSALEASELIIKFNTCFNAHYTLTTKRKEMIRDRLRTFSFSDLERSVECLSQSPFHTGVNDRKWKADPDFLFRNDEQVDKALNLTNEQIPMIKKRTLSDMVLEQKGSYANPSE